VREGRARAIPIKIGARNNRVAQVVDGLGAGERVVLHPSDRIKDGARVAARATE
jgi:HlyD family secretion protein